MKKFTFIIVFVLVNAMSFSQSPFGRLGISISPLPLLPVNNHMYLKMGIDVGLSDHFRVFGEYGYGLPNKAYGKVDGYTLKGEIKYKFNSGAILNDFRPNLYIGFRYYYKNQTLKDSAVTQPQNTDAYKVGFIIHKQMHAFAIKFGDYEPLGDKNRFWIDYYIGFGLRMNNIHCSGMTVEEEQNRDYGDSFILPVLYRCDSGNTLDVDIGFRLIYFLR